MISMLDKNFDIHVQSTLVISLMSNKHLSEAENLTIGNKILWKQGEIAPKEQFLLFATIFSMYF